MARPREYDDDLRVRLVEAAASLLATEGAAAVTTRRVAAAVGTSTTAIYSLIGSKDDLLRAICREAFQRLADHLADVEHSDDPVEDLHRLTFAYHDMAVESPALYTVMFAGPPMAGASEEDVLFSLSTLQMLIDAVQRAIDAGAFKGDAHGLALEVWGLNHGITSLALSGMMGRPEEARERLGHAVGMMLTGFRERSRPAADGAPAKPRTRKQRVS